MRISKFLFVIGLLALSAAASPASAHTVLVSANPEVNSTVDVLPASISLTFAEELISIGNSNSISAIDESGMELAIGEPEASGTILSIKLNESAVIGLVKINYRAVAADGHVIKGDYQFTISPKIATALDENTQAEFASTSGSENKFSIYLIISATLVVGGGLLLFFIWKRQSK